MPVTMKDVAREAGVSLGTVSNYINGKSGIKQSNMEKIEQAILSLGYEVNEVARNLKLKKSNTIGVLIPSFGNVFAVRTISYLERFLKEFQYDLYVCSYDGDPGGMEEQIVSMIGKKIDGLILMPSVSLGESDVQKINHLIAKSIPVIVFDSTGDGVLCDHVVLNNYNAFRESTKYLIKKGHQRIAMILGPKDIYSTEERLNGYLSVLEENHLDIDRDLIIFTDYSKRDSKNQIIELLKDQTDVTVILTAGYRITLGALAAINELHVEVPHKLSLIGFDINEIRNILPYDLTGINIPVKDVARQIVQAIMSRKQNGFESSRVIKGIEMKFIEGESVIQR